MTNDKRLEQAYNQGYEDAVKEIDRAWNEWKTRPAVEIELDVSELAMIAEELSRKDPALADKLWKQIDAAQNQADEDKFKAMEVIG
ncbi:MAG: hypothetical protein LUI87_09460 [Lachnospiraceae bacterium]|nr:hypothetical protein [Lachnospiraceae bacterium]